MRAAQNSHSWRKTGGLFVALCLMGWTFVPQSAAQGVPRYKVDPSWPKHLPNKWILSTITGIAVDKDDHIWIVTRPRQVDVDDAAAYVKPPIAECCIPSPSIIQFDAQGNVLKAFGGPEYIPEWPILEHGLFIEKNGTIWMGGTYRKGDRLLRAPIPMPKDLVSDGHVLKLSPDGKLLLRIGRPADDPTNQDTSFFGGATEMFVDEEDHEVYIADGVDNQRLVVYDSNTGAFKRGWGGYGMPLSEIPNQPRSVEAGGGGGGGVNPDGSTLRAAPTYDPEKPSRTFRGQVMGVDVSHDGLVYVADRGGDRVQVFTKQGKFVKEFLIHPKTLEFGSVWGIKLSRDPKEQYLYVADAYNGKIWILNREDGKELGSIGEKGNQAGEFHGLEVMAFDSKGNLYTAEVAPNRTIQKFVPVK